MQIDLTRKLLILVTIAILSLSYPAVALAQNDPIALLPNKSLAGVMRLWPVNNVTLLSGQRFDLRIETTVPANTLPTLQSLTINGQDFTERFKQGIAKQLALPDGKIEVGQPSAESKLFGQTLRNFSFDETGRYEKDFAMHCDYIHDNPARHGFCENPQDWQYFSIHRFIAQGIYPKNWGSGDRTEKPQGSWDD